jgi:CrcB protein
VTTVLVWLGVFLTGGAGSVLRFTVDRWASARATGTFPWGTFAVNISGCLLLGLVAGLALGRDPTLLAGTAAVGSYTTFSTWVFETQRLSEERQLTTAASNLFLSSALGALAAVVGQAIGGAL